jgi:hypothetical protein
LSTSIYAHNVSLSVIPELMISPISKETTTGSVTTTEQSLYGSINSVEERHDLSLNHPYLEFIEEIDWVLDTELLTEKDNQRKSQKQLVYRALIHAIISKHPLFYYNLSNYNIFQK